MLIEKKTGGTYSIPNMSFTCTLLEIIVPEDSILCIKTFLELKSFFIGFSKNQLCESNVLQANQVHQLDFFQFASKVSN